MTLTAPPTKKLAANASVVDRPMKRQKIQGQNVLELVGSAISAVATVWIVFLLAGITAPAGLVICSGLLFFVVYGVLEWRLHDVLYMKDRLATLAVWTGAMMALIPLLLLVAYVIFKGLPVVAARFPHFLYADMSQSGGLEPVTAVGAGAAIMGTLEQVAIATLISVPIAMLTATYIIESRSWLSRTVRNVIDAMTGTPSIIAGLFIYLLWVVPHHTNGKSGLAAGMALSVMMLPVVTRARSMEVIAVVPGSLREAAMALGSPQWRVLQRVVLPTARAGLVTVIILGIARTTGETAELLFTAGGSSHYNLNPVSGWQDSLPLRVYELIFQPSTNAIREAWGVSFVLMLVIFLLFGAARMAGASRMGKKRRFRRRRRSVSAGAIS